MMYETQTLPHFIFDSHAFMTTPIFRQKYKAHTPPV